MLDKEMDEYVTRVEDQAYEIGVSVGRSQERRRLMENYIAELKEEEPDDYAEFVRNHWSQELLVTPGALVAVIETKISRAVLYERRRIIDLLLDGEFVNPKLGNTGLMAVLLHIQGNADWLSDKEIHALHHKIIDAIDTEE